MQPRFVFTWLLVCKVKMPFRIPLSAIGLKELMMVILKQ